MEHDRAPWTPRTVMIAVIAVAFSLFQIYTAVFGTFNVYIQRGVHLAFGMPLIFLLFPLNRKSPGVTDYLLALASAAVFAFVAVSNDSIVMRFMYVDPLSPVQIAVAVCGIALVLEASRRTVGSVFTGLAGLFLVYMFLGRYAPGLFRHRGFNLKTVVEHLFYTDEGIFGIPVGVSSTYVFLFIMFGVFLETSGAGKFFLDLVTSGVGHFRGGPAKVALFSSAVMGTISGSAIANVVTTGTFTIPLMKKIGFEKNYAAAVEATASTGGQLMPPIMGVAAFIMAQFSGLPYAAIAGAAVIPAALYYSSAFWQIHFYAYKADIPRIPRAELPKVGAVLKGGWYYLLPLAVLVYFLVSGYTATAAGIYGIVSILAVNLIFKGPKSVSPRVLLESFMQTSKGILVVIGAVTAAGIIIGAMSLTGLGANLSVAIMGIAKSNLFLALLFTALAATILGLGMPTSAAYIVCAAVLIPSLIKIGIPVMAAHFFALFYASLSVITPPVALASYAAASLAESDPWKTGWKAFKLALTSYIVPFFFVYEPALLGQGSAVSITLATISGVIGTFALAAAIEGWIFGRVPALLRLILAGAACLLIVPGIWSDLVGFGILACVMGWNAVSSGRLRPSLRRVGA